MKNCKREGYSKNGIIALCSLVYFVSYFSRKDFAAVMAGMISEGAIGRSNAGLVGTMLFAFYGVGQLISGYLGDKIKPKYILLSGLLATAVCNALMPIIPEWAMIVVWGINGLAQAMLWPPIVKILSSYLDHKTYVTANLVVTSAAHVATVILYTFVPICLEFMSWSAVFYIASALAFLSIFIFILALRSILPDEANCIESGSAGDDGLTLCDTENNGIIKLLSRSGVVTVLVAIICCGFLRDGIESWLPTLYSEAFGAGVSESTLLSVILPIFSIFSITLVTALHRKRLFNNEVSGSLVLFAFALICAALLAIFIGLKGRIFGLISLILASLISAAMHGVNFLLISCLPGRFAHTGRAATVGGICNSCIYVGAAISTYGIALLSERFGWGFTVLSWCAIIIVAIVFSALSRIKYTATLNGRK